jgi:hypothetical protein
MLAQRPTYVIGRIDLAAIVAGIPSDNGVEKIKAIAEIVIKYMGPSSDGQATPFNGVMIASWDTTFNPGICNELINFLTGLNLNVYLELSAPQFLSKQHSTIKVAALSGVMFINGSIMPNGDRRDYFNLLPMTNALEIFTGQSCLREFAVLMCEIVEDDCYPTNAVTKRSFTWCNYYGAITWVGKRCALTNAVQNFPVQKPDGAFEWLKEETVIAVHETWRLNSKVEHFHRFN